MKPLRILCAEDEKLMAGALVHCLTHAGHTATHASDGLEAWMTLAQDVSAFDVLITDHQMPKMTGLQLVELAGRAQFLGRIIVLSEGLNSKAEAKYIEYGVHQILRKEATSGTLLLEAIRSKPSPAKN
ncbi:MAG: response regulator [Opitutaceae bacterium]|nr:response regulator [Opitutaceae bacterium]